MSEIAFSERGFTVHLNGSGWLKFDGVSHFDITKLKSRRYLMVPVVFPWTGSMTRPFSMHLLMSNTAKDIAQEIKTDASARCIPRINEWASLNIDKIIQAPGQILQSPISKKVTEDLEKEWQLTFFQIQSRFLADLAQVLYLLNVEIARD